MLEPEEGVFQGNVLFMQKLGPVHVQLTMQKVKFYLSFFLIYFILCFIHILSNGGNGDSLKIFL